MNIQIFGTNKSFDTKKAQRWFKERGIKFQMIDLKEKGMSRGEFENVCRAVGGWAKLVDETPKTKTRWPCCAGWMKASRPTSCLKASSCCASPLCAMAARQPPGIARRCGRSGNKRASSI